jgi:hypothetical protein
MHSARYENGLFIENEWPHRLLREQSLNRFFSLIELAHSAGDG